MIENAAVQTNGPGNVLGDTQETLNGHSLHIWAALASAVGPGSGQLILGKRRSGVFLLGAFGALVLWIDVFRSMATYEGYLVSTLLFLALGLYSICNALLGSSKVTSARPSWSWLAFFLPLGFLLIAVNYSTFHRASGFQTFSIPSTSMEPTLLPGDHIIVDMRYYRHHDPTYGDVVVILKGKIYLLKRVIAVGGDRVQGIEGAIFLNANRLNEPYIEHSQGGPVVPELDTFGPTLVPPGQYLVMGDNRDVSYDSRSFGPISREMIVGKPLYVFFSGHRSGTTIH
jgi:signal peptidase I